MPIIDDYAGIAAELRRIQAEREPGKQAAKRVRAVGAYVTGRGSIQAEISPGTPVRRSPVLARRGWSTD